MDAEFYVLEWIQRYGRTPFFDSIMPWITALGNGGAIWIICAGVMIIFPKTRRAGLAVALALVLEAICCNLLLKPMVSRVRPCDVNTAVQLLIARPVDFSFPSGHTGASFAATAALFFARSLWWRPAVVIAFLIGYSRLYLYVHYPSDVLGGLILGVATGWLGSFAARCFMDMRRENLFL